MDKRKWLVAYAGMGLNLALGALYAWSVFSKQFCETIEKGGFCWSKTQATLPYTIAIAVFALMMVPAGKLQDRFGPRIVATAGGVLLGLGIFITGFSEAGNLLPALLGFGVIGGTGIGLGYAAAMPAAVKWFPPEKKGLVTGLVVSGFGLAPVYVAPLSKYLLANYGINDSFKILGIAFTFITLILTRFIKNPDTPVSSTKQTSDQKHGKADYSWREIIKTPKFYILYVEYICAATAGLMIIGHLAKIVSVQSNNTITIGFLFVAILAVFNAGGRIVVGILSDYIGRVITLALVCLCQAIVIFLFSQFSTIAAFTIGSAIVGFNYGACLALFPATTSDYWGTKNLGLNYGIIFTAWGVGGVFGPILAGKTADLTGNYNAAYSISSALLILAVVLTVVTYLWISPGRLSKK